MKKLIITCALLTSASMVSFAQANAQQQPAGAPANANAPKQRTPEQMAEGRVKMDTRQFNLTPEQAKRAYDVELEFSQAIEKYRASGQKPGEGQMGNLTSRRDSKMKEILTPEQYTKYEQINSRRPMQHPNAATSAPAPTK